MLAPLTGFAGPCHEGGDMADRHGRAPRRGAPRHGWGLFDHGPRFVLVVLLMAGGTTAVTGLVALAGSSALGDSNGPATSPLYATGPVLTTVQVPQAGPQEQPPEGDDGYSPADLRSRMQRVGMAEPAQQPTHRSGLRAE
jgi:hypothetical protein